jgi:hypothetical protein
VVCDGPKYHALRLEKVKDHAASPSNSPRVIASGLWSETDDALLPFDPQLMFTPVTFITPFPHVESPPPLPLPPTPTPPLLLLPPDVCVGLLAPLTGQ